VTHVVLHPAVWPDPSRPEAIREWLTQGGSGLVEASDTLEVWEWSGSAAFASSVARRDAWQLPTRALVAH
jgi:hypothetical protein